MAAEIESAWPEVIELGQIQSRLIHDGVPVERAMKVSSDAGLLQLGDRYRIEREQGDVYLYAQGGGMFVTSGE
jgi:hypothetical protein